MEWVDAPPPPKPKGKEPAYSFAALDELRAHPGRWALLWRYDNHRAAHAAQWALRKRGFDATSRRDGDAGVLYARWPAAADDGGADEPTPIRRNPSARPKSRHVRYPCEVCDHEADTPGALRHHVRREHPGAA